MRERLRLTVCRMRRPSEYASGHELPKNLTCRCPQAFRMLVLWSSGSLNMSLLKPVQLPISMLAYWHIPFSQGAYCLESIVVGRNLRSRDTQNIPSSCQGGTHPKAFHNSKKQWKAMPRSQKNLACRSLTSPHVGVEPDPIANMARSLGTTAADPADRNPMDPWPPKLP